MNHSVNHSVNRSRSHSWWEGNGREWKGMEKDQKTLWLAWHHVADLGTCSNRDDAMQVTR